MGCSHREKQGVRVTALDMNSTKILNCSILRFIFIEFNTPEEADRAKNTMDRHAFDAKYRFRVNLLSEIETFAEMDETFKEPEPEVFKPKV